MVLFIRLLRESFLFAYGSVVVNKLRTFLTLLGITIGIFAIISVFTIVDSIDKYVRDSISSLGTDILFIEKWTLSFEEDYPWWEYMKRPEVTVDEYRELKSRSKLASEFCYYADVRKTVKAGNNYAERTPINMFTYEYYDISPFDLADGRYFTYSESEYGQAVCIIGSELAKKLFEGNNPLGKEIKLMGHNLRIIGVTKKVGKDFFGINNLDDVVMTPLNFGRRLFDLKRINPQIRAKAKPGINMDELQEETRFIMRSMRRLSPMEKDNFALNQVSVINKAFDGLSRILNIAGWIIGGFSILVGGFGIANIMFVSVKERTHIIGIQKACGAKKYVILVQFLFESVLLALAGGILGLLLVFLATSMARMAGGFAISLTLGNVVVGLLVSGIIGIVSGFVPAWTASRLNPVEAINTNF